MLADSRPGSRFVLYLGLYLSYCGSAVNSATLGTWLGWPCRPPPIKSQCGKLASARRLGGATLPPRHSHLSTLPLHSVSAPVVSNRLMVAPPPDRRRCCRRRCGLTTPSQRDHYPPRPLRATPFRGARRASACLPSSGRSFHHHAAPPRPSVKRATSPLPPCHPISTPFLTSLVAATPPPPVGPDHHVRPRGRFVSDGCR